MSDTDELVADARRHAREMRAEYPHDADIWDDARLIDRLANALADQGKPQISDDYVERMCEVMHDAYEAAAVTEGWVTQERSRKPWADVPEANKRTMRVAVRAVLEAALGGGE